MDLANRSALTLHFLSTPLHVGCCGDEVRGHRPCPLSWESKLVLDGRIRFTVAEVLVLLARAKGDGLCEVLGTGPSTLAMCIGMTALSPCPTLPAPSGHPSLTEVPDSQSLAQA